MKKILLFFTLLLSFVSSADEPNWPVYLHPEEECEEVVAYLIDNVNSIVTELSNSDYNIARMSEEFQAADELFQETSCYQIDEYYQTNMQFYRQYFAEYKNSLTNQLANANNISTNLLDRLNQINCTTCIEDTPDVPGNTNGVNKCCDFTGLYQRLDTLIQLQTSIENHVSQLSNILSTVQQIKTNLDYTNFLLEHGFNSITNMLLGSDDTLQSVDQYRWISEFGQTSFQELYWPDEPYTVGRLIYASIMNTDWALGSLNNYFYDFRNRIIPYFGHVTNSIPVITNSLLYVSGSLSAPSPLLYFDSDVEDRDYYTYLTNYYFAMLRGDEEIEESHKTNWFTRVETLLAALVFADGSKTNYTQSAEESITNSIQEASDRASDFFDSVSEAPSAQIELVSDIEKSMYQSLRQFSAAFSSATMPKSVRVMRVEKNLGSKSVTDVVDVTVDVDGRLSDLVELLRSATTLCWVFVGLWMMFKFSVWTVKKIYLLTRYAIDFFNMVLGGK